MLSFKDFNNEDRNDDLGRTDEALDFAQRRARARIMKKNKARIAMGRRRAEKKVASLDKLKQRAMRQARSQIFQKLAKASKDDTAVARKQSIEKRLEKMKPRLDKLARKLLPQVRKQDKERRSSKGQK
jgi:hypothetical protein